MDIKLEGGSNGSSNGSGRKANKITPTTVQVISSVQQMAAASGPQGCLPGNSGVGGDGVGPCTSTLVPAGSPTGLSAAGPQMNDRIPSTSELTQLFECPVCFDYVLPPILQCQNGHLVCQSCRGKITCCPTCRVPIASAIRNLPLEKLAENLRFPCKFSSNGCEARLEVTAKLDHEDLCEFKPYQCPCPGASYIFLLTNRVGIEGMPSDFRKRTI